MSDAVAIVGLVSTAGVGLGVAFINANAALAQARLRDLTDVADRFIVDAVTCVEAGEGLREFATAKKPPSDNSVQAAHIAWTRSYQAAKATHGRLRMRVSEDRSLALEAAELMRGFETADATFCAYRDADESAARDSAAVVHIPLTRSLEREAAQDLAASRAERRRLRRKR